MLKWRRFALQTHLTFDRPNPIINIALQTNMLFSTSVDTAVTKRSFLPIFVATLVHVWRTGPRLHQQTKQAFFAPWQKNGRIKTLAIIVLLSSLQGCESLLKKPSPEVVAEPTPQPVKERLPSAAPMLDASKVEMQYAQSTLNKLGFNAGPVDGIWGPRSARAIRAFESKYGLKSAKGLLSKLNLYVLEKVSNTARTNAAPKPRTFSGNTSGGIAAKLDQNVLQTKSPQLIILDQSYQMLAKPNPFSEQLSELAIGTGIYVISLQEGWYEVESENQQRGYIKAD